jgi:hypothetical protein
MLCYRAFVGPCTNFNWSYRCLSFYQASHFHRSGEHASYLVERNFRAFLINPGLDIQAAQSHFFYVSGQLEHLVRISWSYCFVGVLHCLLSLNLLVFHPKLPLLKDIFNPFQLGISPQRLPCALILFGQIYSLSPLCD